MKENNKKWHKRIGEAIGEIGMELILAVVFAAVGVLVLRLCGVEFEVELIDPDILMLIGVLVFAALGAVIYLLIHMINKWRKNRK